MIDKLNGYERTLLVDEVGRMLLPFQETPVKNLTADQMLTIVKACELLGISTPPSEVKSIEVKPKVLERFKEEWTKAESGTVTAGYSIPPLSGYHRGLYDTHVENAVYAKFCTKTTICVLELKNGFEVVGSSASRKPEDFRLDAGQHYALVDALTKLGAFVAYAEHEAEQ